MSKTTRLLRAIRRWDGWITRSDLFMVLGVSRASPEWGSYQQRFAQLVKRGCIESTGEGRRQTMRYRIATAGLAEINAPRRAA